jgi:hypothetical protein
MMAVRGKSNQKSPQPGPQPNDYRVGYGRPPAEHQFRPGQSGNPRGRPRGILNLKTDLAKELAERVQVTENGRRVTLSKQRLLLKALTAKAVKGDTKAAGILINLVAQTLGLDPHDDQQATPSASDAEILKDYLAHLDTGAHQADDHPTEDGDDTKKR